MKVPFVDLKAQYSSIKTEIDSAIQAILTNTEFVTGPTVARFEEAFAKAHKVPHCVSCGNGTQALHLILWALGIGRGDEVILPSHTFFATAEAVHLAGATPVLVEVDEKTYTIDPAAVKAAITPKTKAVMAVHLYGQPADMPALKALCDAHGLQLVEDAAQAHTAAIEGTPIGGFGVAAGFSFYPGKNLGAYGEGGAVLTRDEDLAKTMRMIRDHGMAQKYHHQVWGHNYRMEGIQGAVLEVKMKHIDAWSDARRRNALYYDEYLRGIPGIQAPVAREGYRHVYHLYIIRSERRDELMEFLKERGIASGLHYPIPVHMQAPLAEFGYKQGDMPLTERICDEIVSLPMYPELTEEQIRLVCETIREFHAS